MKKVLVVGGRGMAGHVIDRHLRATGCFEVKSVARNVEPNAHQINLDVKDVSKLEDVLKAENFDYVINCIGILNKTAEDNPAEAVWVNSYFPHFLAQQGNKLGYKLVHISTDCVFSGTTGGYREDSLKDGIGFYAQSKALGEVVYGDHLTFRTSIIGPELNVNGIGLFNWFMTQEEISPLKGFKKAYWTGVSTIVLAKAIELAISQRISGLYHLVNEDKISKYELIKLFNTVFKDNRLTILEDINYSVDKSLVNSRSDFSFVVPSYKAMVEEMKMWMKDHKDLFPHYDIS